MYRKVIKLEHVFYEMWMYLATYHSLMNGIKMDTMDKVMVHNAVWESHLIHLRSMLFFFENQETDKDSRNIYVDDIVYRAEEYTFAGSNVYIKNDISQTLAHLSTKRAQMNKNNLGKDAFEKFKIIEPIIYYFIKDIDVNIRNELREELEQNYDLVSKIREEVKKDIV